MYKITRVVRKKLSNNYSSISFEKIIKRDIRQVCKYLKDNINLHNTQCIKIEMEDN